jgi:hypothetical protein
MGIDRVRDETVVVHWIRCTRDGATSERPVAAVAPDDGDVPLGFDGVRPGDVCEYAYTRWVRHAVRDGRFAIRDRLGTEEGARRMRFVATWPDGRTVHARVHAGASTMAPAQTSTSIRVEADDLPVVHAPSDAPTGWDGGAWIELSELASWDEVAAWARRRWAPVDDAETAAVAASLEGDTPEARALAALRRIQQAGDALSPPFRAPALVALLHAIGIEDASVALVSLRDRGRFPDLLPSFDPFDHTVVRATIGGVVRWLDPARAHEREPLDALAPLTFGRALLLRRGAPPDAPAEIVEIPIAPPASPEVELVERFVVAGVGDQGTAGTLRVETIMRREMAWAVRAARAGGGAEGVGRMLAAAYANELLDPHAIAPLELEERADGSLRTVQQYTLGRFWMPSRARPGESERDVGAWMVLGRLDPPQPDRPADAPIGIAHPTWIDQRVQIDGDTHWARPAFDETVRSGAFEVTVQERSAGTHFERRATYRTLAGEVAPGAIAQHAADVAHAREIVRAPLRSLWVPLEEPWPPTWALVAVGACLAALLIVRWRARRVSAAGSSRSRLGPRRGTAGTE